MRFGILGEAAAWQPDGTAVLIHRPKVRTLLTLLALRPGDVVPADDLVEGIYADTPPPHTANALQAQVSRLRRQLEPSGALVERSGGGYRLAVARDSVDAHRFAEQVDEGRRLLAGSEPDRAAQLLHTALGLWRGPPLADAADSPVARPDITRLEDLRLGAHELLAEADIARGQAAATAARLRELVAAHPLRESLWRWLIRALADAGRRAEALAAFDEARTLLADELGTDPSPALSAEHVAVLREEPEPGPAPAGRGLPAQLTSLVGREAELARLAAMLDRDRLVTVTGPGGAGKTRLAIEAAERSALEAHFVELADIEHPTEVPAAVCSSLGLRAGGDASEVTRRLTTVLGQRPMLLLLDNCEHVTEVVAGLVARLAAGCASLTILSTSREPLRLTGEVLCPTPALGVPALDSTPDDALDSPAVRMFADRVAAGDPEFEVDASTCADVVAICRALDGMPLALELAAARARTLPLGEIATGLDDPFRLLSHGDRTKATRQQTLHSVVEWSWGLLEDDERTLACRLSVFSGGFTLGAARAVCGLSDTENLLAGLVDRSFLELRGHRYRMLEVIRTFTAQRLAETGEPVLWHDRHAHHFLSLAQEADPRLRTADQLEWLGRLDADYPNLRSALHWSAATDGALALRLTSALSTYWWLRGRRHEAAALGRAAAEGAGVRPPDELAEEYVLTVFNGAADIADPDLLRSRLDEINRLTQDWTGPSHQPILPVLWAWLSGPTAADDDALRPPTTALLGSDPWSRALQPLSDGLQQVHSGDPAEAERSFGQALEQFRALGERWGLFQSLDELSRFASWRGEQRRAVQLVDEAIELAGHLDATDDVADLVARRSLYWLRSGDLAAANMDARRCLDLALDTGTPDTIARARSTLADVARWEGDLASAAELAARALAECPTGWLRPSYERLSVMLVAGHVALAEGHVDQAVGHHLEILAVDDSVTASAALDGLAAVAAYEEDWTEAATLLGAADAVRGAALVDDRDANRVTAAVGGAVGADALETHRSTGLEMTRGQALDRATRRWRPTD